MLLVLRSCSVTQTANLIAGLSKTGTHVVNTDIGTVFVGVHAKRVAGIQRIPPWAALLSVIGCRRAAALTDNTSVLNARSLRG